MKLKTVKYFLEYIAFISFAFVIRTLPYHVALKIGSFISFLAFILMRRIRKMVYKRLRTVFGNNITHEECKKIIKEAFYHLALSGVDLMRLDKFSDKQLLQIFEISPTLEQIKETKMFEDGGIIATPHMGSWELGAVFFHKHVAPLTVITAKQHNPYIDNFFKKQREKIGIKSIERNAGMTLAILSTLQKKQIIAILPDLRSKERDIEVTFLNNAANISHGTALLGRIAGVPIFPCIITRKTIKSHKAIIYPAIFPNKNLDKKKDMEKMTKCLMEIFDKEIKKNVPQWFWFNKRWILDPPDKLAG